MLILIPIPISSLIHQSSRLRYSIFVLEVLQTMTMMIQCCSSKSLWHPISLCWYVSLYVLVCPAILVFLTLSSNSFPQPSHHSLFGVPVSPIHRDCPCHPRFQCLFWFHVFQHPCTFVFLSIHENVITLVSSTTSQMHQLYSSQLFFALSKSKLYAVLLRIPRPSPVSLLSQAWHLSFQIIARLPIDNDAKLNIFQTD